MQLIFLEQIDAGQIKEGDTLTLMNWGNLKIVEINKHDNRVLEIIADLDLENKVYSLLQHFLSKMAYRSSKEL